MKKALVMRTLGYFEVFGGIGLAISFIVLYSMGLVAFDFVTCIRVAWVCPVAIMWGIRTIRHNQTIIDKYNMVEM